jgi:PLP dependent protein
MLETILKYFAPQKVKLVAVSKTKPLGQIMELYNKGHKIFGENRVQELVQKQEALPKDIEWHFIGHLQSKKVKYLAPFVELIHSVDSLKLLKEINKQAQKNDRVIDCLLQFHIASEESKFGFDLESAGMALETPDFQEFKNIRILGVMGMASFTQDEGQIRREFKNLKNIFEELKNNYFQKDPNFKELSMGMSGDYKIAVEEGSTIVRIGSLLFGKRD